ncbi:hypothetical protein GWI33_009151 [Rhynchophorus ferrugineus]|uniref:BZIP domain-containing protein n=1 Tax=Rhynchophorus ferrugineus TaxID=354439 RepID=A0A834IC12_RHYFE|nr:hypothetical protein GWI33_009151 [Rhynchophorus ferrugineus]
MFEKYSCKTGPDDNSSCNMAVCDIEETQKRHDMLLNLEFSKNPATDETPTPTRLIRNCEEVGLFQDLQIVNPFDEIFKHAVENPSASSQVPVTCSDDTLHTPQIYPNLEDSSNINNTAEVYSLNNVMSTDNDDIENDLVIVLDSEEDTGKDPNKSSESMKDKIKTALIKKANGLIAPVPLNKLKEPQKNATKEVTPIVLHRRERNRASANRCRKKKQKQMHEMKMENVHLKVENKQLIQTNRVLKERIKFLEDRLKQLDSSLSISNINGQINPTSVTYDRLIDLPKNTNSDNARKKYQPIAIKSVPQLIPIQPIQTPPNNNTVIVIVNGTSPTNSRLIMPNEPSIISLNREQNGIKK